ncbi:hypothetical protein PCE1_001023 [Barthelona sp. PCE]
MGEDIDTGEYDYNEDEESFQNEDTSYYDENGNLVVENGYYDESGNYIEREGECDDESGEYDPENEEYAEGGVDDFEEGCGEYLENNDDDCDYIDGSGEEVDGEEGYYGEEGNFVEYEGNNEDEGYYDEEGNFVEYEDDANYENEGYDSDLGFFCDSEVDGEEYCEDDPEIVYNEVLQLIGDELFEMLAAPDEYNDVTKNISSRKEDVLKSQKGLETIKSNVTKMKKLLKSAKKRNVKRELYQQYLISPEAYCKNIDVIDGNNKRATAVINCVAKAVDVDSLAEKSMEVISVDDFESFDLWYEKAFEHLKVLLASQRKQLKLANTFTAKSLNDVTGYIQSSQKINEYVEYHCKYSANTEVDEQAEIERVLKDEQERAVKEAEAERRKQELKMQAIIFREEEKARIQAEEDMMRVQAQLDEENEKQREKMRQELEEERQRIIDEQKQEEEESNEAFEREKERLRQLEEKKRIMFARQEEFRRQEEVKAAARFEEERKQRELKAKQEQEEFERRQAELLTKRGRKKAALEAFLKEMLEKLLEAGLSEKDAHNHLGCYSIHNFNREEILRNVEKRIEKIEQEEQDRWDDYQQDSSVLRRIDETDAVPCIIPNRDDCCTDVRTVHKSGLFTQSVMSKQQMADGLSYTPSFERMSEGVFANVPLFNGAPSIVDVKQTSYSGNCFLIAGLIGIADRYPQMIVDIFEEVDEPNGYYRIKMFDLAGIPIVLELDDYYAIHPEGGSIMNDKTVARWPELLMKAYSVMLGGFAKVVNGGSVGDVFTAFTGAVGDFFMYSDRFSGKKNAELFRITKRYMENGALLASCSTDTAHLTESDGFVRDHAYSILDMQVVDRKALVKVANPWITGGELDDSANKYADENLSADILHAFNHTANDQDGMFLMNFDAFRQNLGCIFVNHILGDGRFNATVKDKWDEENNGAFDDYLKVPYYELKPRKKTKVSVLVRATNESENLETVSVVVHVYDRKEEFKAPYDFSDHQLDYKAFSSEENGHFCQFEFTADPSRKKYLIVPTSYESDVTADLTITFSADEDFTVYKCK